MFKKITGSQKTMPTMLEFSIDTVYVRKNITAITQETPYQFDGWEYEEAQYTYPEYVKLQDQTQTDMQLAVAELAEIVIGAK